jgi:hypothetical protein
VIAETWPGYYDFLKVPISASGHVYSGTKATPGKPVVAEFRVEEVPCTGGGCQSKFTLGERSYTSSKGRYHLWLPQGTYRLQFHLPGVAMPRRAKVTTSDNGNVEDIYLGESSVASFNGDETDKESRRERSQLDTARPWTDPQRISRDDRGPVGPVGEDAGAKKYDFSSETDADAPAQVHEPSVLELACKNGLMHCNEEKEKQEQGALVTGLG